MYGALHSILLNHEVQFPFSQQHAPKPFKSEALYKIFTNPQTKGIPLVGYPRTRHMAVMQINIRWTSSSSQFPFSAQAETASIYHPVHSNNVQWNPFEALSLRREKRLVD